MRVRKRLAKNPSRRLAREIEHLLTALEIQDRIVKSSGKRIPWDKVKAKHGL
jgi:hypothetical protein